MRGNVTIDPVARAKAVAAPQICEVRNLKSGQVLEARRLIESVRYDRLIQIRNQIKDAMEADKPRIACAICGTPVYLVASPEKAFFFRHRIEDGSCPAQTRSGLSEDEIRALKYKGAQESEAHRRLKGLIERSLRADSRFTDIQVEATWRAQRDPRSLRRPDVQAKISDIRIAFEAQLSTTFLDVVVGRKAFYRSEGALLVWVLPYFDPLYRRLTTDDVLFNNNSNVLVVDGESTEASEAAGRLMLRCAFRRPLMMDGGLGSSWENRLVPWDDLTIDVPGQRVFAFDSEGAERTLVSERVAAADQALRDALFAILTDGKGGGDWQARVQAWSDLRRRFQACGLELPGEFESEQRLRNIVCGVRSAFAGQPVGYGFEKLIQVAHHLADRCPEAMLPFGHALRIAGHAPLLVSQDRHGRWERKATGLRERYRLGDPSCFLGAELLVLVGFLFPQIADRLGDLETASPSEE